MGKIICLMGKSNSGKDTIFGLLLKDNELCLHPIITYTTRPIRENEHNGSDYYFIDKDILANFERDGKIIEKRTYYTTKGEWLYSTIDDGSINLSTNNYLIIVTLQAYENLRKYYGCDNLVPIYIEVEDSIRLERAINREKQQQNPDYNELCRRFLADNKDFSLENLSSAGITKKYCNINIEDCYQEIKKDLISIIS